MTTDDVIYIKYVISERKAGKRKWLFIREAFHQEFHCISLPSKMQEFHAGLDINTGPVPIFKAIRLVRATSFHILLAQRATTISNNFCYYVPFDKWLDFLFDDDVIYKQCPCKSQMTVQKLISVGPVMQNNVLAEIILV